MSLQVTFLKHDITYGGKRVDVVDISDLSAVVLTGNWSTGLLNTEHRALLNWIGSDFLAIDIDGDMPLQVAVGKMASSGYRYFIGTTQSHQKMKGTKPPCDRYRIVLQLTSRCADLADWEATYRKVTNDLTLPFDPQARDAVRYWKPCQSIVSLQPEGRTLDVVRAPAPALTGPAADRPAGMMVDLASARADVAAWSPAVQGENGSRVAWDLAVRLVRGYGLTPEQAVDAMAPWNEKCQPPWSEAELLHKCRDAETKAAVPWGFRFYLGTKAEVLARALPKYGPPGSSGVPYRVFPDGSMVLQQSEDAVRMAIHEIWKSASGSEASLPDLDNAFRWWRQKIPVQEGMPTPVVVDTESGPALARIATENGPTPAWDEFLQRLNAPTTFLAWLWMVTLPDASRQILWIQGAGNDGKSVVNAVLGHMLGAAAITLDDSFMDKAERWMGSAVFGKRLVIVDDTKMTQLTRRGPIHRLSGRSPMMCEFKGQQGFMFTPNVAIICTSNMAPEIGDSRADRSRLLPITVAPTTVVSDAGWRARLIRELPALMGRARDAYGALCIRRGEPSIRLEPQVEAAVAVASETDVNVYRDRLEKAAIMFREDGEMSGRELQVRLNRDAGEREFRDIVAWLVKQPGVSKEKTKTGVVYHGIGSAQ